MAIEIIPNQPVNFVDANAPEDCKCLGQCFSQLVNKDDETQFQLKSSDLVVNGSFTNNLGGWTVYLGITGTVLITNESVTGECDGEATISPIGGVPGYTYSIDGLTFQGSATFTGLCSGQYTVIIKDSTGRQGSVVFYVTVNVACGAVGCIESDLFPYDEAELFNCDENDFFCRDEILEGFDTLTANADASTDGLEANWIDNTGSGNALADDGVYFTWHNQTQDYWASGNTGNFRNNANVVVSDALMAPGDIIHLWVTMKSSDLTLISNPEHVYIIVVA